jgi:hypothetical protein
MPLTHRPFSRSTWYVLAVIAATQFLMIIGGILYTNHVAQANSRKWCTLLTTLDAAYRQTPPQTPTGQQVASDIHALRADLRCPDHPAKIAGR